MEAGSDTNPSEVLMTFPFEDAEPIGETEELRKQAAVYEAGEHGHEINRGHALGGTAGSIDGQ